MPTTIQPVHGSVRLLSPSDAAQDLREGRWTLVGLTVGKHEKCYVLRVEFNGWSFRPYQGDGYYLQREPDGYLSCTCPDARHRKRQCKHANSLEKILKLLGGL